MGNAATQTAKRAAYPAYKPSGVAWLGDVPDHWEVRRLKYAADLINVKVDGADNDLPYTGLEHIESWTGRRITPNGDGVSEGQANLYRRGDVLFGKLRPYLAKAHAAESDGICTGELLVLRPKVVQQKFLVDYVLNPDFVSIVDSSTYGAKMPRANWDFIANLPALIPPGDEQRAIAAFLDRETARIDALIEKKRRQIELLQEKRSALISHAVTKGLDPHAAMKDSGIEWLGPVPAHWTAVRIRRLLTRLEQGWSPQCEGREAGPDEWGIMKAGCANYGRFNELEHKALPVDVKPEEMYEIKPGDVIMSRACGTVGLVGSAAYVENCRPRLLLCDKLFRLHPRRDRCDARYLHLALNSRSARAQIEMSISGADGLANNITQPTIKDIVLAVPPLDEQQAIVTHVRQATSRIDGVVAKVERSIDLLREHRTALISAAVTGKIDVGREV
ncbi:MAG TPA: restriction endonuclease subunit S [Phycisphaerae bacterium]|nr:restriction endonuclease subunit S [Phycisphaerae bacterium]HQL75119.1 restriction endonuclease subunit S [Phycisphaerae bacterium]